MVRRFFGLCENDRTHANRTPDPAPTGPDTDTTPLNGISEASQASIPSRYETSGGGFHVLPYG